ISETKWMKTRMPVTVFWETSELTAFLLIINAMTYKMTAMTANMPISVIECPTLRSSNAMTRPTTGRAIFSQNEYWLVYEKYFFMFFSYGGRNNTSASFSHERYFGNSSRFILH